jgi:hypothetical protein
MSPWLATGFLGGLLGAAVMAAWSMVAGVLAGVGIDALVALRSGRLLGLGRAPTPGEAVLLGLALQLATGALLGAVFAAVAGAWRLRAGRRALATGGAAAGVLLWLLTAFGGLAPWGPSAPTALGRWVLAVGYVLYGATTAAFLAGLASRPPA